MATRVGARPTPWVRPLPCGPPSRPSGGHLLLYGVFRWEKIISHLLRRNSAATRRNQSRAPAELFCRGNIPLGGGNHHYHHHHQSSHREGSISINIFTSTISSQTLVHLLYSIFVPKPQIGTCGLLVVLITPCS